MAGQAGWYRAPGEEGLLRYWNGTTWTDHRQADPAAAPLTPPSVIADDTDPMAEYERQFATPSPSFDLPGFDFDPRAFDSSTPVADSISPSTTAPSTPSAPMPTAPTPTALTPTAQPLYRPQAAIAPAPAPAPAPEFAGAQTSKPRSFAPRPASGEPADLGPIALGPVVATPVVEPLSEFDQVFSETQSIVDAPKAAPRSEPLALEAAVPFAAVGIAPNRTAVLGAFRSMVIALAVVLVGIGAMVFFNAQSAAGAGELKTNGIVTSLGSTSANSCTPIARFAVKGKSFTANSNTAINPCPVGLGQSVDVIYTAANPASAARIQLGTSLTQYLWVIPLLGALFFLASLTTFVVRAGSIASGIRLVRERSASDVAAATTE